MTDDKPVSGPPSTAATLRCGAGISSAPEWRDAADIALDAASQSLAADASPDLLVIFAAGQHARATHDIFARIAEQADPRLVVGMSAEVAVGGGVEAEGRPAVSLLAASLPGVRVHGFTEADLAMLHEDSDDARAAITSAIDASPELRATMLLADPFSTPATRVMTALNRARHDAEALRAPLVGGMASAGARAGENRVFLAGRSTPTHATASGLVGVSVSGPVRADAVVSQGCRAFGPLLAVTRAKGNLIFELDDRPAVEVAQEAVEALDEDARRLIRRGLLLGIAADEEKRRYGIGDFLVRGVLGVDASTGAVAVGDVVRPGQTVRLHVRDESTATTDLQLLLDGQKLHGRPAGALLFTCNGRGTRLFSEPNHDAAALQSAFRDAEPAESAARAGRPHGGRNPDFPLAGCFAAGEIGPVGAKSYLHGQTASAMLLRPPESGDGD